MPEEIVTEEQTRGLGETDGLCTGNIGRETTGKHTELCIEEHTWKYTGNAMCSGGVEE